MLATDMLAKQSNLALIWATNKIYFRIRFFGKLIFYVEILVVSGSILQNIEIREFETFETRKQKQNFAIWDTTVLDWSSKTETHWQNLQNSGDFNRKIEVRKNSRWVH